MVDDRKALIYCIDAKVLVKILGETSAKHLGDFIENHEDKLENEDLQFFTKMFSMFSKCVGGNSKVVFQLFSATLKFKNNNSKDGERKLSSKRPKKSPGSAMKKKVRLDVEKNVMNDTELKPQEVNFTENNTKKDYQVVCETMDEIEKASQKPMKCEECSERFNKITELIAHRHSMHEA